MLNVSYGTYLNPGPAFCVASNRTVRLLEFSSSNTFKNDHVTRHVDADTHTVARRRLFLELHAEPEARAAQVHTAIELGGPEIEAALPFPAQQLCCTLGGLQSHLHPPHVKSERIKVEIHASQHAKGQSISGVCKFTQLQMPRNLSDTPPNRHFPPCAWTRSVDTSPLSHQHGLLFN